MGTLSRITPPGARQRAAPPLPDRPVLRQWPRLRVEQARQFLMELDDRVGGADLTAAMYLLGETASHARQLLDVIDAAVTP